MPIALSIPGVGELRLEHLVLDVNGTLACDGRLEPGVVERLQRLRQQLTVHLLTADTHGRQAEIDAQLELTAHRVQSAADKEAFVRALPTETVAAMGNGANDVSMLHAARLGVAVLGPEGLARDALLAADVVARSACDALDLLLVPARLRATLRA